MHPPGDRPQRISHYIPAKLFWLCAGIMVLAGCAQKPQPLALVFTMVAAEATRNALRDLRFYIYDIELYDAQTGTVALQLHSSARVHENIALIDLRPGITQAHFEHQLQGEILPGEYRGIRFKLGLPFSVNHANPLIAPAPVNQAEMFWSWQLGYKFLRMDLSDWVFHLGSTGCRSSSPLRPPQTVCAQPNIATIEIKDFNPQRQRIGFDVDRVLAALTETKTENCTGAFSQKPHCTAVLAQFGLDAEKGLCEEDCVAQKVFYALEK